MQKPQTSKAQMLEETADNKTTESANIMILEFESHKPQEFDNHKPQEFESHTPLEFVNHKPQEIEGRSFEIIGQELAAAGLSLDPKLEPIIKRVIHTTADFSYAESLIFSPHVVTQALRALEAGATIVTDTNMVKAGINKPALAQLGGQIVCYISDPEVSTRAKADGSTRAVAAMAKATELEGPLIFAIGNAPTALKAVVDLHQAGLLCPELVIGVPVGFVNVVEAKELLIASDLPYIVNRGRKGGSNVAAAIVNALMYLLTRK